MGCGICYHPNRRAVEAAIEKGVPYRQIESLCGYSRGTISTHACRCMGLGRRGRGRHYHRYGYTELYWRPIEHALEALSCRELGEAWGIGYTAADALRNEPWRFVDNPRLPSEEERTEKLRAWLRRKMEAERADVR